MPKEESMAGDRQTKVSRVWVETPAPLVLGKEGM